MNNRALLAAIGITIAMTCGSAIAGPEDRVDSIYTGVGYARADSDEAKAALRSPKTQRPRRVERRRPSEAATSKGLREQTDNSTTRETEKGSLAENKYFPGTARLVSIRCGPRQIKVARTAAVQFTGFCRDFYAIYKWAAVGGYRGGTCSTGSKHPCGGAVDVAQTCRSSGPGHCLPRSFPVSASERIAHKWGLKPGSEWGWRDVGHFETRGVLAGHNWPTNRLLAEKKAIEVAKLPEEPAPKHWPVVIAVASASEVDLPSSARAVVQTRLDPPETEQYMRAVAVDPVAKPVRVAPGERPFWPEQPPVIMFLVAYTNSELPVEPRPIDVLINDLKSVPVADARTELKRASRHFGIPADLLFSFTKIESDFNCKNRTGSYKGALQLGDPEFKKYGPKGGDIWNCRDNIFAAANMFIAQAVIFEQATGVKSRYWHNYLVHQQGADGAIEHINRPERLAWRSMCAAEPERGEKWCRKAIWGNVPSNLKGKGDFKSVETITSGAFVAMWRDKVNKYSFEFREVAAVEKPVVKVARAKKHRHVRLAVR